MIVHIKLSAEDVRKAVAEWLNNEHDVEVKPEEVKILVKGYVAPDADIEVSHIGVVDTYITGPYR